MLADGYAAYEDASVTVLDKLTYAGNLANLEPVAGRFNFVRGDICDSAQLVEAVPGPDAVVHFAAETHVNRSIAGADEFVTSNVTFVQVMLDECLQADVPRVVHESTAATRTMPPWPPGSAAARAVMIGRAYLWELGANGQDGVENVLDLMRSGIDACLLGLGHASISELSPEDLVIPSDFTRRLGG
jgi:nucleoside-diphosphate-sugar epimerase